MPIKIKNLLEIQTEVIKHIELSNRPSALFYPTDNLNLFLGIDPLKKSIIELGLLNQVLAIAVIVVTPGSNIPIHVDTGNYIYSLNIPISGYNQTFVNFYKPLVNNNTLIKVDQTKGTSSGHVYKKFLIDECELLETHESNTPYIMNTQIPHNVQNKSSELRIFLLVRLNTTVNDKIITIAEKNNIYQSNLF